MTSDKIRKKYSKKVRKIAEELAKELLESDPNLERRFASLDEEVHDILIDIGNNTMRIMGDSLEEKVKKKPVNKN